MTTKPPVDWAQEIKTPRFHAAAWSLAAVLCAVIINALVPDYARAALTVALGYCMAASLYKAWSCTKLWLNLGTKKDAKPADTIHEGEAD